MTQPMARYKARKKLERRDPLENYEIMGYIAAGTYGRVFKAKSKPMGRLCAIKKFKLDKEGAASYYTGISQSAVREISLCRELRHENVVALIQVILEDKSTYMVFDYAEHDLLQILHHHCHPDTPPLAHFTAKSIVYQILNGLDYLHRNWVLHRDLKPANIMITGNGVVKIGDLGLARLFSDPLQSLFSGDKVVVTIWYRAPELLLGGRHYTPAIDLWAVGCIFAEILALRPIFKGEEAKMDSKKVIPFQKDQVQKVVEILGTPTPAQWPNISVYPDYANLQVMNVHSNRLEQWYRAIGQTSVAGLNLLRALFDYNPITRLSAAEAMAHPFFSVEPRAQTRVFGEAKSPYPARRITNDTNVKANAAPKRPNQSTSTSSRKKSKV